MGQKNMDSDILNSAKIYQKNHEWGKAVDCYEQYMEEKNGDCDDDTYVSYAKCLRLIGKTRQEEKELSKGKERHPQNERLLCEFYNLYDSLGEWESAKSVANSLVKMNPKQANYYFR